MWRADLARTRTGGLGARLDYTPAKDAEHAINESPTAAIRISQREMARVPDAWWEPWRNSIVFSHRFTTDEAWTPITGGPITGYTDIGRDQVTVQIAGIEEMWRYRWLIHEHRDYESPEKWLAGVHFWDWPLGQVAWEVVQDAMAKPRGGLPIVHGTPAELIAGATPGGRAWWNWDLSKGNVWAILQALSVEEGGPDFRFTPRYGAGTDRRVEWVMEHGTLRDPRIAHSHTVRLDATAARSPVMDVRVQVSALAAAHRVYATGSGEGAGTIVRVAEGMEATGDEMPLMEAVVSDTSVTTPEAALALAQGRLSPGGMGAWQVSCTVQASRALPVWQLRVGAPVRFRVSGHRPFPEQWVRGRILKAGYDLVTDRVALDIEQEVKADAS